MQRFALKGLGACGMNSYPVAGLGADADCPCEITEVTENKTVTIPVKSQKIVCKPETKREGVVDCETIQRALGQGRSTTTTTNTGTSTTNTNTAGGPSNLLGLGDVSMGFSIDFMSLAIGGLAGYLAAKYI